MTGPDLDQRALDVVITTSDASVLLSQSLNRTIHPANLLNMPSNSQPQPQSQSTPGKTSPKTPLRHSLWTGLCSATRELSPFGAGLAILKSSDSSDKALAERPERPRWWRRSERTMSLLSGTSRWAIWVAVGWPAQSCMSCLGWSTQTDVTLLVPDITSEGPSYRAIGDISYASGFPPPSYQGATFLAASMPCLDVIPHLLKGGPADWGRCPTDTERETQPLGRY